jgi:acylpyruvate hydrolase
MYFKIDVVIEYVSQYMGLNEGDLILTGTPLGAGPLKLHDRVEGVARVDKETIAELKFTIVK